MDKKPEQLKRKFGLIGRHISYSFSRSYFQKKFDTEGIKDAEYVNFDLASIEDFKKINIPFEGIAGFNVTIPYKESIIPYLDSISKKAKAIGAVNTIRITKKGRLKGYNTDCYGFKKSLQPYLKATHRKALILGTGGASKAIAYALKDLGISYRFVSRSAKDARQMSYKQLTPEHINTHQIIINATPLGTFPDIEACPDIPYKALDETHILFDLIYNPEQTKFLRLGKGQKARTINGSQMLKYQAEKSWRIWNRQK